MQSEIKRWGNGAAVRLSSKILAQAKLDRSSPISTSIRGTATEVAVGNLDEPSVVAANLIQTLFGGGQAPRLCRSPEIRALPIPVAGLL